MTGVQTCALPISSGVKAAQASVSTSCHRPASNRCNCPKGQDSNDGPNGTPNRYLMDNQDTLSQREKEIVICVVKGMTNKEIAEKLFLSIHTVITHRRNISKKLQIHSAAGLTIYAIVNKLVALSDVKDL